jgi:uncharacterized protein YjbI with pentapeptide repeats
MASWFSSLWQQVKKHFVTILVVAIILVIAIALIIVGYRFDWTGFNGNNKSGKTLWDWLQLLFIPAVLTLGAIWYTARQNHDLQITLDNQRETALQTYLDKMSELLLHANLRTSKRGDDVRNIAHTRTLTVLPQLDSTRKRSVILFLARSELITRDKWIIDMSFADLSGVDLSQAMMIDATALDGTNLQGANLSGAELSNVELQGANLYRVNLSGTELWKANMGEANLNRANLSGANLREANLGKADLTGANLMRTFLAEANLKGAKVSYQQLKQAKSLKGATMPDGKKHV